MIRLKNLALASLSVLILLNVVALGVRVWFVGQAGAFAGTSGFEEFSLYNTWKVMHGLTLYEWPQKDHYLLTSYNTGFYHVYAAWGELWGADGEQLVPCLRWLTLVFGVGGVCVQAHLLRVFVPPSARRWVWISGVSFLTWFGTTFSAWCPLTARPDIPAVALALAGFTLAMHARETRRDWLWIVSSLLFVAAWSFKQSVVWIFAGTVLAVLTFGFRWRGLVGLVAPFGILTLLMVWFSGAEYRYNVFAVPGIYRWFPKQSFALLGQAVALNLFLWGFGAWACREGLRDGWRSFVRWGLRRGAISRLTFMVLAAVPAVIMGTCQMALHGSNTNNIMEGFVMISLLAGVAWMRFWQSDESRRSLAVGVILLVSMMPLPIVQLVQAAKGTPNTEVRGVSIGNLTKLNSDQLTQRRRFAEWLRGQPKPLWIRDAMLQLPWFSTDNQFPSLLLDYEFEADASAKRVLDGAGFSDWIRRRYFACLLLKPNDWLLRVALRSGYVVAPLPEEFKPYFASEYGINRLAPILLIRSAQP